MADQESIVIDVAPARPRGHKAGQHRHREGTVGASERMQKSLERMADILLKLNDRSRSSMERLTQSIEKQAGA